MSKNLNFVPEILRGGRGANAHRWRNKKARDFTDFLTQKSTTLSTRPQKEVDTVCFQCLFKPWTNNNSIEAAKISLFRFCLHTCYHNNKQHVTSISIEHPNVHSPNLSKKHLPNIVSSLEFSSALNYPPSHLKTTFSAE